MPRHVGPRSEDIERMLETVEAASLDQLIDETIPSSIRLRKPLDLDAGLSEQQILRRLREIASQNQVFRSFIGMGYADCFTPPVIQRNILENPGWYTQYTPYQAEISQGRLEALLNFQTMVTDLTGMSLANSSLLDEGTAAAEGMSLCLSAQKIEERNIFFVASSCHPQTIQIIQTRAAPLGIEVHVGNPFEFQVPERLFGMLLQYPCSDGKIVDYRELVQEMHDEGVLVIVAADLLSLCLLAPPGEWGADVVCGSSQRFGVPMGYGGPHAAYFATREEYKRLIPGRIVGVSQDAHGHPAYRLALQTREQHIRRARATSNICTAQVLLAIMASMYAVYHGSEGLQAIARSIHRKTAALAARLEAAGFRIRHPAFFDTLRVEVPDKKAVLHRGHSSGVNLREFEDESVGITLDETVSLQDLDLLCGIFDAGNFQEVEEVEFPTRHIPAELRRSSPFLSHPVFRRYRSETELLRYMSRLQAGDLSLAHSMIPLGSCTMKLNATVEMVPISWPEFSSLHPFAPVQQAAGFQIIIDELEKMLKEITGLPAVSLQPNAGSQGEYAGLLTIQAYHRSRTEGGRRICLIPTSAHGTNPASAVMAGMRVITVRCDDEGNVDVQDLRAKAGQYSHELGALMITYPSTHGVFEPAIQEICDIVHEQGGQVYMDGANLNAQVGLCRPGDFGIDVCHLNLHKTFCIPHGGGGPGVGPIAVAKHLEPFLPGHFQLPEQPAQTIGAIAAAPWGSAGILPISWAYIRLMGGAGLTRASQVAILNANYVARRLSDHYPVLYRGRHGRVGHECILDCRDFKKKAGITVGDIAKRLMDYGFHAPTVSFPVVETLMVEPTESESLEELDRFCEAMISIRQEIQEVEMGLADRENNVLKNAPHTAETIAKDEWHHPYTRQKAAYPLPWTRQRKFWTAVGRVDEAYGDRNLFCTCIPVEEDEEVRSPVA